MLCLLGGASDSAALRSLRSSRLLLRSAWHVVRAPRPRTGRHGPGRALLPGLPSRPSRSCKPREPGPSEAMAASYKCVKLAVDRRLEGAQREAQQRAANQLKKISE